MTVLTIPPEIASECSKKLFALALTANRDAMTLIKQAMALAKNEQVARPLGVLKKYVREHKQYGSGEVSEVIGSIEAAADPEHIKRLERTQAKYDTARAKLEERQKQSQPACWRSPVPAPGSWQARQQQEDRDKRKALCHNGNVIAGPWQEGA